MSVEDFDKNKKRKEEVSELLRENLVPRGNKGTTITIQNLIVLMPTGCTAAELLATLRRAIGE